MLRILACALLMIALVVPNAAGQGGDGSLRGSVVDEQHAALPGVTITATSTALITPSTTVTDDRGEYRLINLPPGTYTITAELTGFAVFRREGVVLRAGSNFQIEQIVMQLGTLQETVTVSGDAPMLEVSRPSNVLNIEGEFLRQAPLVEGKFWSDFLQMTPGVMSRPHNDGSGRQNFGNAVDHRDAVVDMEGMMASNYNDSNINRTGLSTEAVEDVQVKTGGVDASAPMGYGLVINMVSKSGGNDFHGSVGHTYQPFGWNADNTGGEGTPAVRSINQGDYSLGGPIRQDNAWFFFSGRWQSNQSGASRTPDRVAIMRALFPDVELQDTTLDSWQPWLKITSKLGANHTLTGVYQGDRLHMLTTEQIALVPLEVLSTGGALYGGKLTSVWGDSLTTTFTISYNNKGGNSRDSYEGRIIPGPSIHIHQDAFPNAGIMEGTGLIVRAGANRSVGCDGCMLLDTASVQMYRGDLTWYKDGWAGSHEFGAGFLLMPHNRFEQTTVYLNDGFILESQKFRNPDDPSQGTVPFHRQYVTSGLELTTAKGDDHDYGFYVQDTWKPTTRFTATLGIRFDHVRRFDVHRSLERQRSLEIGPRLGFSYLLTADAKNVLRGSYARVHEQLQGGRHEISTFGGDATASFRDTYDIDGDGIFETVVDTPPTGAELSDDQFAADVSQPIIDEWIVGYRRQFPGQIAVDIAGIYRKLHNLYALVDINGFYPDGPGLPFGGFGRVDPDQGIVYQVQNNDWSAMHYQALQITITKNLANNFQALAAIHRQWQQHRGTWNPTDPARFIQPDAFPNNRLLWRTRGPNDHNSYPGSTTAPMWNPFSYRFAGTWHAPYGMQFAGSYSVVSGGWSGWIVDRLAANDPDVLKYGPATVVSSTGARHPNPLATRIRFAYPTRGEGQVLLPAVHTVGRKITKVFSLGGSRNLMVAGNILNLLNGGRGTEYARGGANRLYGSVFLQPGNLQAARSFQLDVMFRF
jgi:outer membrane receptor protein involved in Fe transport